MNTVHKKIPRGTLLQVTRGKFEHSFLGSVGDLGVQNERRMIRSHILDVRPGDDVTHLDVQDSIVGEETALLAVDDSELGNAALPNLELLRRSVVLRLFNETPASAPDVGSIESHDAAAARHAEAHIPANRIVALLAVGRRKFLQIGPQVVAEGAELQSLRSDVKTRMVIRRHKGHPFRQLHDFGKLEHFLVHLRFVRRSFLQAVHLAGPPIQSDEPEALAVVISEDDQLHQLQFAVLVGDPDVSAVGSEAFMTVIRRHDRHGSALFCDLHALAPRREANVSRRELADAERFVSRRFVADHLVLLVPGSLGDEHLAAGRTLETNARPQRSHQTILSAMGLADALHRTPEVFSGNVDQAGLVVDGAGFPVPAVIFLADANLNRKTQVQSAVGRENTRIGVVRQGNFLLSTHLQSPSWALLAHLS